MIKLSILIANIPSRELKLQYLVAHLKEQGGDVEILTDSNMGYNIGTKRNLLLERATGEYIVFVDDDDEVAPDYVQKILAAMDGLPDCIGISGHITTNGENPRQWHISKDYGCWYELDNVYYRTPNHISPVRRELALQTRFKEIAHGEDADYSARLLRLLHTENKVQGNIYHYIYSHYKE